MSFTIYFKIALVSALTLLISGCVSFSISTESLVSQLVNSPAYEVSSDWSMFNTNSYLANKIEKIKCINDDGAEVWLYPDKNTQFEIYGKDGEVMKCYFNTLYFRNASLFGERSRILGGKRAMAVKNIDKIIITTEFPSTEPVR
jgi:hypothetical protein